MEQPKRPVCRYCCLCHEIDDELYYCNEKEEILQEYEVKTKGCKCFAFYEEDVITGKMFNPRISKEKFKSNFEQLEL